MIERPFRSLDDRKYAKAASSGVSERVDSDFEEWRNVEDLDFNLEKLAQTSNPDVAMALRELDSEESDQIDQTLNESIENDLEEVSTDSEIEESLEDGNSEVMEYEKDILDEISDSLRVIADNDGSSIKFLSDVLGELGNSASKDDMLEEMPESKYSRQESEKYIGVMEDAGLISNGKLNQRVEPVADIVQRVHDYVDDIESKLDDVKERAEDEETIESIGINVSQEYSGRASESFDEREKAENISELLEPFVRSKGSDSNPLALMLNAVENGRAWDLADSTGYSTDNSASTRLGQIAQEGYLEIDDGEVNANPAAEVIKETIDKVYDEFSEIIHKESRKAERIEKTAELIRKRSNAFENAQDLDTASQGIIDSEYMKMEEFDDKFREEYSTMARRFSENYSSSEPEPKFTDEYFDEVEA